MIAIKLIAAYLIMLGLAYPLIVMFVSQVTMPEKAKGSLIKQEDRWTGSQLIGQAFKKEEYFWPRPSAVDYDPLKPAGGSNFGPTSKQLKQEVEKRKKSFTPNPPADLVYASGSGLDPHIFVESAYFQVPRIAKARSIEEKEVLEVIHLHLNEMQSDYVNVLLLNLSLDRKS